MQVKTSISGFNEQDLSVADIQQRFWENSRYSGFPPHSLNKSKMFSIERNSFTSDLLNAIIIN